MHEAQVLAVGVIERVLGGRNLDTALAALWRHTPDSSTQQRALVQDLCYGVLRHLGPLDAMLAPLLAKPLRDDRLRQLLRIALYQLLHTHAAQHAVVDQAVQACVALNAAPAKGLVNAVLRGFLRKQQALTADLAAGSPPNDVARYSFPQWWIDKIRAEFPQQYADILSAGNQHAPLSLRVNRRRGTRDDYMQRLTADGIAAVAPASALESQAVVLDKPMPVQRLPGFSDGHVSVQDVSAQLAAPLLDVADGMRVLDACAAPGGKSAHLLELADISLTAVDQDSARLQRVKANLQRLGLSANVVCGDAANPAAWWDGVPFERILADVPCSASGVTRRHPDIKWSRRESDIAQFTAQQQAIVDALWRLLAAGGKFLYVTCSVFREENHRQVERFLDRHPDARSQTLPLDAFPGARASLTPQQQAQHAGQILPDAVHDGFYYALLQKN